jgi:hypothetical protein
VYKGVGDSIAYFGSDRNRKKLRNAAGFAGYQFFAGKRGDTCDYRFFGKRKNHAAAVS